MARFHKSFKLLPGVRGNVRKKGISSVSVGPRGAKLNINNKGTILTTSIPVTDISHTAHLTQRLDVPSGYRHIFIANFIYDQNLLE